MNGAWVKVCVREGSGVGGRGVMLLGKLLLVAPAKGTRGCGRGS